ncbi:Asp23/Gls24 family envelope stress response protein [Thermoanaerobacterium sp. DL9XJH110]|uniref:Asp23/Gls24 family envelope stress response protein n=1 Tax=Thermoanaerobacterium sp. DL9XJH110 TaxID=3386643 RepID=UPI003BB4EEB0
MRIVALIGKSGTGKSHKAHLVARQNDLEFIIDDGLLIHGNRVVAGFSAKREETKLGAIKRAIFQDPKHAAEVRSKIREMGADGILILGTSEKMINAICKTLSLQTPEKVIRIEDISTPSEINIAQRVRNVDGKHVIPVPTLEIKKDFSGYLLDPLKIFYRKGRQTEIVAEKSVVRPTYSYLGRYTISDTTVSQIVMYTARQITGVAPGGRVIVENYSGGVVIRIELVVEYGIPLKPVLLKVQEEVARAVEFMTALNVLRVDVTAKKFSFKD